MLWQNTYTWMVQDEIQRVQKEEKQTEKRIKNIIVNNKKNKNAILTVNKLHFYFYFCGYLRGWIII